MSGPGGNSLQPLQLGCNLNGSFFSKRMHTAFHTKVNIHTHTQLSPGDILLLVLIPQLFVQFPFILPSFSNTATLRVSFMFNYDPCPLCPCAYTHTHILVVSVGPLRGCSVYCEEDVWSCRLKSLTSLVPTGGLYSKLLTGLVWADCVSKGVPGLIVSLCV